MEDVAQKIAEQFAGYPERTYDKGQILLYSGEDPTHIFYMLEGRVRQYDISYRGDEIIVNVFRPPAFFPMSWAMNRTSNKYFFKTEDKVRLRIIPVEDALVFVKANPDVLYDLLSRVYRGADALMGRIVQLMAGSAKTRLLFELANEAHKLKADGNEPVQLEVKESDLAARTGMSRETISREIHGLKEAGVVSVNRTGVRIENLEMILSKLEA